MSPSKISVVIPCYNLGRYLDEAVDSVLGQTCDDVEIIVVNDGSTDPDTVNLLRDYCRPKTRVLTTENRGLGAARNLGLASATGAYVCALDADDVLVPTYFEKAAVILDSNPAIAFVSSWLEAFGDERWIWRPARCDLATLLTECTVCTAALARRSALQAVGGYDVSMPAQGYEDWDLWITLVERGFAGTVIPEVLFRYRKRPGSMSSGCCSGEPHLVLMRYLIEKHHVAYETHLEGVLAHKAAVTADLLRANDEVERHINTWLLPIIERRREELENMRRKLRQSEEEHEFRAERNRLAVRIDELERGLQTQRAEHRELSAALARIAAEAEALKQSKSWKVTSPLRAVYSLWLRMTGDRR